MNVRTFAWITPFLLLWACFGSPYKAHFEEMAGPAEAHWRGVKLGETWEKVQELEDAKALMALDSAFAKYHFHYSDSEYYEVQYQFVEGRLNEIYVQIFLDSEQRAEEVTELALAHFESAWKQEALLDQGVYAMSKTDAVLEIMDESPFHGPGMVRLLFRDPPPNASKQVPKLPS